MSATLALLVKLVKPELKISILERLDNVALESSAAWNNAGTGHSALCELNYTPEQDNGDIDCNKAYKICKQFEMSKQFWSYLISEDLIDNPKEFINTVPHYSWVTGEENVRYLKKRFEALKEHFMFDTMEFTTAIDKMRAWFPLIMENRIESEVMAATRIERGAEMNFGALTKKLFHVLKKQFNIPVYCNEEVLDIYPDKEVEWAVEVKNTKTKVKQYLDVRHVFIGVGDPPMSTPHLDTRFIDGKSKLLFGPFAGFSPKFLKEGSNFDLLKSIKTDNIKPMLNAFWDNLPLTQYLVKQVTEFHEDRMDDLRKFIKNAKSEDWEVLVAGQRLQIIKKDHYKGGKLQFGTEVVRSKDVSITSLLGASPGTSTAIQIMLEVFEIAFPEVTESEDGKTVLKKNVLI